MLKISEKTNFGIFFLCALAEQESSLSLADVARRWSFMSQGYLEEIAFALKRAGFVSGKKGKGGGYTLARPAHALTLLDIVTTLEGPLAIVETTMHAKMRSSTFQGWCMSRRLWGKVQQHLEEILREITLADLVKEEMQFSIVGKQKNKKAMKQ